jgi:transposase
MKQIRSIIQARLRMPHASIRQIAAICRCSRPAVTQYLQLFTHHPVDGDELAAMTDTQLAAHIGISTPSMQETEDNARLAAWLDRHVDRLTSPLMTRRLLHEEYTREVPAALKYSQFCFVLQQRLRDPDASGMFEHKAGDKIYLDFTGRKHSWTDGQGLTHTDEVFVAVCGASARFFALPVANQRQESFAAATQAAFEHFGGVPRAVVPDCLKSAVLHHDGYEPVHNPLFQRLLEHYGVVSIPARPHHPKDKASVESTVNIVYRRIMARLAGKTFADRSAMLEAWARAVQAANAEPFQKLPGNRLSRFDTIERPALRPLPEAPFSLVSVLHQTVQSTLAVHVPEDKTAYSVPTALQGKQVEILVQPSTIEVWHDHRCHATHQRSPGAGKVINTEHLSLAQGWYLKRNPDEQVRALSASGVHVGKWASHVLETAEHEDIAWRVLDGLQSLARKFPDRIDLVCRLGIRQEDWSLKGLKAIIKAGDDATLRAAEASGAELPFHENIRGAAYYSQGAR